MGNIVVGYVPTPEGEAALQAGIAEARLRDATVIVVSSHLGGRSYDDQEAAEAAREAIRVEQVLAEAGVPHDVQNLVRGFEPAEDLISIAEANHAELVVIGLRRRTPVGKLLMGSNAQRILMDCECPVLAVKAPH